MTITLYLLNNFPFPTPSPRSHLCTKAGPLAVWIPQWLCAADPTPSPHHHLPIQYRLLREGRENRYVNWKVRGNIFVLAVNIFETRKHFPPSTLCSQLFSESNWTRTDTEQCGEADGAGEPQRRAWEVCQWDGGAEITTPRVGTQSPVLWFEQPVRVLSHASRHSYEVCSYIFLLHEMKTEDPVLPGMPCDIVISATLSSLLAMGNLPSFCVCFLPILGFGWFKPFNSLLLKQTPLEVCGPLQRCAPSPGPFFSDSRRVHQPGKNQDCSRKKEGKDNTNLWGSDRSE